MINIAILSQIQLFCNVLYVLLDPLFIEACHKHLSSIELGCLKSTELNLPQVSISLLAFSGRICILVATVNMIKT